MQFFLKHIIRLQWETILWRSKTKKHYCRTLTGKFHCIFPVSYTHLEIRSIIGMDKTLHIQVTAQDTDGMLRDAETILNKVDDQVCVKVPVTLEGIKAIKTLKKQDVNVTATAIYSKQQGFLAMEAGADYIAPYFNRMENMGIDPDDVIASFAEMIGLYGYHTQILGASFKNAGQVDRAFLAGAQTATMDPSIL